MSIPNSESACNIPRRRFWEIGEANKRFSWRLLFQIPICPGQEQTGLHTAPGFIASDSASSHFPPSDGLFCIRSDRSRSRALRSFSSILARARGWNSRFWNCGLELRRSHPGRMDVCLRGSILRKKPLHDPRLRK